MRDWCVTVLLAALASPLWAQGGVSVAVVNVEQVLREAEPVREAIDGVDSEIAERQQTLDRRENELRALMENFQSQGSLLSDDARNQLERDILDRRLQLNELESDLRQYIETSKDEVITPTFERVYAAIRQIAQQSDIDLVLRSDAAVFAATDLDLTSEVVQALNRESPANLPPAASDAAAP